MLNKTEYNHSFSSASDDGNIYRLMFPGHHAAKYYHCSATKSAYFLRYGITKLLKVERIGDIHQVLYTFKFDETTTSQVKKQYDA